MGSMYPDITPAVLGWSNPSTAGGASLRLYARDKEDDHPATPGGRTIERAIIERDKGMFFEGDLYLVVRLGDRFVSDRKQAYITRLINNGLREIARLDD